MLSYTAEVFYAFLEEYNLGIWPAQAVALAAGLLALILVFFPGRRNGWIVKIVLAGFWLWTALVFYWLNFAEIDFSAPAYASFFALQCVLLTFTDIGWGRKEFAFAPDLSGVAGLVLAAFALAGYPLITMLADHPLSELQVIGTAPAPTVIFTLGLLLMIRPRLPWYLPVIPLAAAAALGANAWFLDMPEQLPVPAAGIAFIIVLVWRRRG